MQCAKRSRPRLTPGRLIYSPPKALLPPPDGWAPAFASMARDAELVTIDYLVAFGLLADYFTVEISRTK